MAAGDIRKPIAIPGRIATGKRYQPENSLVAVLERVKVVDMMVENLQKGEVKGARTTPEERKVMLMSLQMVRKKKMDHIMSGASQRVESRVQRIRQDPCVSLIRAPVVPLVKGKVGSTGGRVMTMSTQ